MGIDKAIEMMGWYTDSVNGVEKKFNKEVRKLKTVKELAERHHEERYDTDWDSMQEILMEIWKLTK